MVEAARPFVAKAGLLAFALWTWYLLASVLDLHPPPPSRYSDGDQRRSLAALDNFLEGNHKLLPWAEQHLVDVTDMPDPSRETALFWHIPKSGGTTAKRLYECLGQTLANRLGADPRFGHHEDKEVVVFQPFATQPEVQFVNVDTTTKQGILRAASMGLVASKKADMIFTSDVNFAADHLFDPGHKGRIFALFRNPVDRLVSKFWYLQKASWENTYRPEWAGMGIVEWATEHNLDENFIVKKIVGKRLNAPVDISDLVMAKEIIRRRFVVGLMNDMEESLRRFNVVLGLDWTDERGRACKEEHFGPKDKREGTVDAASAGIDKGKSKATNNMNSNPHPKECTGHDLDMILYNYITLLYAEQKSVIDSYATSS